MAWGGGGSMGKDGDGEKAAAAALLGTAGHVPAPIRTPSPLTWQKWSFWAPPPLTWQK